MADEIQLVNIVSGAGVATEDVRHIGDDEAGELVYHPVGQNWMVARYNADYFSFLGLTTL